MNARKVTGLVIIASVLLASQVVAQEERGPAGQAVDDERPPADEVSLKSKKVPSQEAGDTSEVMEEGGAAAAKPAEPTPMYRPISAAVTLGWGTDFESANDLNLFGLGTGVRGGYTFDFGLYLGGQFIYYFGGSAERVAGVKNESNEILLGADVGYNIKLAPIVIRPSLGLGIALRPYKTESDQNFVKDSDTPVEFYVAPGALVTYPIGMFFVGGDARFVEVLATESIEAVTIMGVAGINFGNEKPVAQ
jgi:hypothetical protein